MSERRIECEVGILRGSVGEETPWHGWVTVTNRDGMVSVVTWQRGLGHDDEPRGLGATLTRDDARMLAEILMTVADG